MSSSENSKFERKVHDLIIKDDDDMTIDDENQNVLRFAAISRLVKFFLTDTRSTIIATLSFQCCYYRCVCADRWPIIN